LHIYKRKCYNDDKEMGVNMHRLQKLSKKSNELFLSQLLTLQDESQRYGITMTFINKFIVQFRINNKKHFLRVNPLDNEYLFVDNTLTKYIFYSFYDFKKWLFKTYSKGE